MTTKTEQENLAPLPETSNEAVLKKATSLRTLVIKFLIGTSVSALFFVFAYVDFTSRSEIYVHSFMLVCTCFALREFFFMCSVYGIESFDDLGTISGLGLFLLHWFSLSYPSHPFAPHAVDIGLVIFVFGCLLAQSIRRDNHTAIESIGSTMFGVFYVWFLISFLFRLNHLTDGLELDSWAVGYGAIVSTIVCSKIADVGAYIVGKNFGKRKLIPRISPNKSWEGYIGGVIASMLTAVAYYYTPLLDFVGNVYLAALFGFLMGTLGQLGDLAESLLKRGSGVKDAGGYIPGFGGVLDIMDCLMVSLPVAYYSLWWMIRY